MLVRENQRSQVDLQRRNQIRILCLSGTGYRTKGQFGGIQDAYEYGYCGMQENATHVFFDGIEGQGIINSVLASPFEGGFEVADAASNVPL
jgi:hypothetical protein